MDSMQVWFGDKLVVIASVMLERSVFDRFCDEIGGLGLVGADEVVRFKELGHIAMIGRDEETEFIFSRFGVDCDRLVIMVDGSITVAFGLDPELN